MIFKVLWKDRRFKALTLLAAALAFVFAFMTVSYVASAQTETTTATSDIYAKALGSALAVGLAGIGGGYAVGVAGAAAVSAVAENREISGTVLLYVALGEGIAIYGLLVALMIIFVL
ncbi:MAG: V-type ATP synthase subunit K [Desulfurococcales archaeon]|nr:V-type ATP synthase subunit K [Desulfurococcales archaeon]MEB3765782.1 V-type ATP synthase subunit K [Desulfurococcales archaeon]